jgi:hypothetical protein
VFWARGTTTSVSQELMVEGTCAPALVD